MTSNLVFVIADQILVIRLVSLPIQRVAGLVVADAKSGRADCYSIILNKAVIGRLL